MKSLLSGRTELAETRLAVTATQIVERLRIRASHLKQLMAEELEVDTKLLQIRDMPMGNNIDMMGLESKLDQSASLIRSSQRREDTECWKDLTHVMRDFLNAWEGFSRNEAKNRFLAALPNTKNMPDDKTTSMPTHNYPNDLYHNSNHQR